MLGTGETPPNISMLTVCFFVLYLLMATQDIAVDGWAISMLSRKNVGWASTANAIGQSLGNVVSFILFMALNSPEFCNAYLRVKPAAAGMISLGDFMSFWGWVFLLTTAVVRLAKPERPYPGKEGARGYALASAEERDDDIDREETEMNVRDTYISMWSIINKPVVRSFALVLLTSKMGFAAADAVTSLKLQVIRAAQ